METVTEAVKNAEISTEPSQTELLKKIAAASEVQSQAAEAKKLCYKVCMIAAAVIAAAVIITCAVLIPRVSSSLNQIDSAVEELSGVATTLNQVDFVGMGESINELTELGKTSITTALEDVQSALENMNTAIDNISQLDVEGLNDSIENLSAIVEPMAKLFGKR